jgi:hypothetical protein
MRRYFRSFLSKNPCKFNFHNSFHSLLGLTKSFVLLLAKDYLNGHKPSLANFISLIQFKNYRLIPRYIVQKYYFVNIK